MKRNYQEIEPGISRFADASVPGGFRYRITNEELRKLGEPDPDNEKRPKGFRNYRHFVDDDQILQPFVEIEYSADDHKRWQDLFATVEKTAPGRITQEALDGLAWIRGLQDSSGAGKISDLAQISSSIKAKSGFELVPVMGLLPNDVFFKLLKDKKFPITRSVRRKEEFAYTSFPDAFHDLVGHAPMFLNPDFCNFVENIGALGMKFAGRPEHQAKVANIYWYTIEFGLMNTTKGLRVYGAGIISSAEEIVAAVEATHTGDGRQINRLPFKTDRVLMSHYNFWQTQELYFAISSPRQLANIFYTDLEARIADIVERELAYSHKKAENPVVWSGKILPPERPKIIPPNRAVGPAPAPAR